MNMPRKRGLAAAVACAFILALATPALAGDAPTPVAVGARLAQDANEAQLVFDLSLPIEAHVYALPSPDRIIVDLPEVNFQLSPSVGRAGRGKRGRTGQSVSFWRARARQIAHRH